MTTLDISRCLSVTTPFRSAIISFSLFVALPRRWEHTLSPLSSGTPSWLSSRQISLENSFSLPKIPCLTFSSSFHSDPLKTMININHIYHSITTGKRGRGHLIEQGHLLGIVWFYEQAFDVTTGKVVSGLIRGYCVFGDPRNIKCLCIKPY